MTFKKRYRDKKEDYVLAGLNPSWIIIIWQIIKDIIDMNKKKKKEEVK